MVHQHLAIRTRMAASEETVWTGEEDGSNDGDQDMFFASITVEEVDVGYVPFVLKVHRVSTIEPEPREMRERERERCRRVYIVPTQDVAQEKELQRKTDIVTITLWQKSDIVTILPFKFMPGHKEGLFPCDKNRILWLFCPGTKAVTISVFYCILFAVWENILRTVQ